MQAEKLLAPEPEDMVCTSCIGLRGVDVDGLLHASDISGPGHSVFAVNDKVEPRIAECVSCGGDREGAVVVNLGSHYDDGIAIGQGEDNLDAG